MKSIDHLNMASAPTATARRASLAHYDELARIGKVLSSPVRLRLLDLLRQGSRNVESLAEAAGVSLANSSQHLQQMRAARLVEAEKRGQHVEYRLAGEGVSRVFSALRDLAEALLPEMDRLRLEVEALGGRERESLLSRIRDGQVTLLDVRPAVEYRAGHLPGARSIPLPELRSRLGEIPRSREVVAYCRGPYCFMASEAAEVLRAAGFRASHLDLGAPDLRARGVRLVALPEESGRPAPRSGRSPRSSPTRTDRKVP
jgi:rhodanese-related sulfurtransferase